MRETIAYIVKQGNKLYVWNTDGKQKARNNNRADR